MSTLSDYNSPVTRSDEPVPADATSAPAERQWPHDAVFPALEYLHRWVSEPAGRHRATSTGTGQFRAADLVPQEPVKARLLRLFSVVAR